VKRATLLQQLADAILRAKHCHPIRVAIDGVDAAGKTTLAEELAELLRSRGRPVIRASIDGFHNPREVRHKRGAMSPEGYYRDSFNYDALRSLLLEPLGPGGNLRYRAAVFDFRAESPVQLPEREADPAAVLLFDGVFLLRPELLKYWDFRIFVEVSFDVSVTRALDRDVALFGNHNAVKDRYAHRYVPGQQIYLAESQPERQADVIVRNDEPSHPGLEWRI
jgi:uridine kinase